MIYSFMKCFSQEVHQIPFIATKLDKVNIPKPIGEIELDLLIQPNPTIDFFSVALLKEIKEVQVYNSSGPLMLLEIETNRPVNIIDFTNEICIVKVISNEGIGFSKIIERGRL